MIELKVDLGDRSYPVLVGAGARHRLGAVLPTRAKRAVVVTQSNIGIAVDPGVASRTLTIGEGEEAKNLGTIEDLCRDFAEIGLTRNDVVVALGGGVVTDSAGFAAAIWHRGTNVIHVPTTLLGQVDAAIGGKTAVNLPEGKNLVGAFWQPSAVICDTEVLETLPPREYLSGSGEVVKTQFLQRRAGMREVSLFDLPLDERIAYCIELKAKIVSADEREGGLRAVLNYGHTLAHALEIAGSFDLRHGEAVAIGLYFAAVLAHDLDRIDDARLDEHRDVIEKYGLPVALPANVDFDELLKLMKGDKKALEGLTFVLDGRDGPEVVSNVSDSTVLDALGRMPRS